MDGEREVTKSPLDGKSGRLSVWTVEICTNLNAYSTTYWVLLAINIGNVCMSNVFDRVLSALVGDDIDQEKKIEIISKIKAEYFTSAIQFEVFNQCSSIADTGEEVGIHSIWDQYPDDSELGEQVGAYCSDLMGFNFSANIDIYVNEAIKKGVDAQVGREIQSEIARINKSELTEVEKRDAIADAIEDSKQKFKIQIPTAIPDIEQQAQIMADCILNPIPESEFVFHKQIIPMEELTVMPGFNGSGKSFLSLQLAMCKAMGKTFMVDDKGGSYFEPVKKGRVLILSVEDESKHYGKRCQNIIRHFPTIREVDKQALIKNLFFRSFSELQLDGQLTIRDPNTQVINKSNTWRKVKKMIIDGGFELVVIDPLHYCINAGDENSNADMGQAVQVLIQLAKETGAAILSPCHTSESNPLKPRGATSITDRSRSMLTLATISRLVEKKVVCSMPGLSQIKCDLGAALRFAMAKNSHGQLMTNYWMFERKTGGVMVPMNIKCDQDDVENIIIEILGDVEMMQKTVLNKIRELHEDLKMSNRSIENRIKLMIEAGMLRCQKGPLNSNILSVNGDGFQG